jgi:hypothetical protein
MSSSAAATRTLDHKVKEYLISAIGKFENFKREDPKVFTLLVLVWT